MRRDRRGGERAWRQGETDEEIHLVIDRQFLRQATGRVGNAGIVLHDQLDLAASDRVAVQLHVEPHARFHLPADGSEGTRLR